MIAGIFCWGLVIYPFNIPYLLHLPAEETDAVIGTVFALLFVCVATVAVRTKWCLEEDLFLLSEDEKARPLFLRVVTSEEWIADGIVFAVWALTLAVVSGITSGAIWYRVVLGVVELTLGSTALFAVLDCVLYAIARKRADRRLRKLQRKREQ
ncbi:MAG: hypothetical protein IKL13_02185 [Clostridia bacterium]|nr:hypothetical protein [Clostridia bacterium]